MVGFVRAIVAVAAGLLCGPPALAQIQGQWVPTGAMASPRVYGAALRLSNGNVLAVGGLDANNAPLASAEMYVAKKGAWSPAGAMAAARTEFGAAVLADGRVLVAGGLAAGQVLAGAEIYNPRSNAWSAAAPLLVPRASHTLTLFADGRVLAAGGCTGAGCATLTATSEIYDPTANAWSMTGSLQTARALHSAVRLGSGRVLAIEGETAAGLTTTAELFDPTAGTWSAAASLAVARLDSATSVLADGRVLVSGGVQVKYPLGSAELYDPTANAWTSTGSLAAPRYGHSSTTLPDGTVLLAGGYGQAISCGRGCTGYIPFAAAEIYNPATNSFVAAAPLNRALAFQSAALAGPGQALIAGGDGLTSTCCVVVPDAELYTPLSLAISAYALNFGFLQVGLTSPAQTVTVNNVSGHAVSFTGIAASGDFSQSNTCPATLMAGQGCAIMVSFAPTAAGPRRGAVTLTDTSPGSPKQVISLTGTGETLALGFSPAALNFGTVAVGTPSTLPATLINDGAAPVTISGIAITPANKIFTETNDCPGVLAVQQSCTVQVTFTPPDVFKYTASLAVTNSAGQAAVLPLVGRGLNN